jgi:hypothetical protein
MKNSHIKPGMYVSTSEIQDTEQWKQVIDAFVAAGFHEEEGYTENCALNYENVSDWKDWYHVGIEGGYVIHYDDNVSYGENNRQVTVDFILGNARVEVDTEGWIENTSGECPYPIGISAIDWNLTGSFADITHHRLHKPSEALTTSPEAPSTIVPEEAQTLSTGATGRENDVNIEPLVKLCKQANCSVTIQDDGFNIFNGYTECQAVVSSVEDVLEILNAIINAQRVLNKWDWI